MVNPFANSPGLRDGIPILPGAFPLAGRFICARKCKKCTRGARFLMERVKPALRCAIAY